MEDHARDIVVIGASAGGVEATAEFVRGLPADLPASVFIAVHTPASLPSRLPNILGRAGRLPVRHAKDGEEIVRGSVYVAPPDRHMVLEPGRVRTIPGPRENRARPAIDTLFRSAAHAYQRRVVGVLLSGVLDDGTAGINTIKQHGGCAIVQDPRDALFPDMAENAARRADV